MNRYIPEIQPSQINGIKETVLHSIDEKYYKEQERNEKELEIIKQVQAAIEKTLFETEETSESLSTLSKSFDNFNSTLPNSNSTDQYIDIESGELVSYIEKMMKNGEITK